MALVLNNNMPIRYSNYFSVCIPVECNLNYLLECTKAVIYLHNFLCSTMETPHSLLKSQYMPTWFNVNQG